MEIDENNPVLNPADAASPQPPAEPEAQPMTEPSVDSPHRSGWNRRTVLKAAALGTAAAAWLNKGGDGWLHLGPMTALANDLSGKPCTAQDVEIIGTGVVQNEPCSCTAGGTFTAHVQFTVRNNTSTGRYCIALHLPGGFGVPAQDVILRDATGSSTAPGKSGGESFHDTVLFGDITGFPCNTGGTLVCIGQQGVTTGKCAPNTCTTIAWNTSPGAANCTSADQNPPGGQCRHQGVCIQGYGASLACKSGCTPSCGGEAVLTATVSGGVAPYTYCLSTDGKTCSTPGTCAQTFGPTSNTSHDFTVTVTQSTTYTLTVVDSQGCCRDATTSLTANPITVSLGVTGNTNCNGVLTFTATVSGGSGCSYTWTVDGQAVSETSNTLTYTPSLDGTCHTVAVSANCGGCTGSASKNVRQCVTTTLDCTVGSAAAADTNAQTNQLFVPLVKR